MIYVFLGWLLLDKTLPTYTHNKTHTTQKGDHEKRAGTSMGWLLDKNGSFTLN
jgi:hypothetical protein